MGKPSHCGLEYDLRGGLPDWMTPEPHESIDRPAVAANRLPSVDPRARRVAQISATRSPTGVGSTRARRGVQRSVTRRAKTAIQSTCFKRRSLGQKRTPTTPALRRGGGADHSRQSTALQTPLQSDYLAQICKAAGSHAQQAIAEQCRSQGDRHVVVQRVPLGGGDRLDDGGDERHNAQPPPEV